MQKAPYPSLFDDIVKCPNDFFHGNYIRELDQFFAERWTIPTVVVMSVSKNYINVCKPKTCKRFLSSFHDAEKH